MMTMIVMIVSPSPESPPTTQSEEEEEEERKADRSKLVNSRLKRIMDGYCRIVDINDRPPCEREDLYYRSRSVQY